MEPIHLSSAIAAKPTIHEGNAIRSWWEQGEAMGICRPSEGPTGRSFSGAAHHIRRSRSKAGSPANPPHQPLLAQAEIL